MSYLSMSDVELGMFDPVSTPERGAELREAYQSAQPFPHIVIDDLLPEQVLENCLADFPLEPDRLSRTFDDAAQRLKTQYTPDFLSPRMRSLFYSFNSRPFIAFVENLTGISGLIPDPFFLGGGFHELKTGGHLSVHADFNHHDQMDLERRVNVLIYLNRDWTDADGGQLELWENDMSRCVQSVVPVFNRSVVFTTTSGSNHGNPNPIAQPEGRSRRSIALYYYTSTWGQQDGHTTIFRARPGADAELPRGSRAGRLADELLPSGAVKALKRAKGRLTR